MKSINVYKCKLVKDSTVEYNPESLNTPEKMVEVLKAIPNFCDSTEEHLYMICFNSRLEITGVHELSHGDLDQAIVSPRAAFMRALLNNAAAVAFSHNHPSGNCSPSKADIDSTHRLIDAGTLLGIKVIDHIIISADSYYSMNGNGYF